jgi:hypothetical protein
MAARVCALAAAGEIWVSSSVTPLIVGSGIGFADRGDYALKGVPERWTLLPQRCDISSDLAHIPRTLRVRFWGGRDEGGAQTRRPMMS